MNSLVDSDFVAFGQAVPQSDLDALRDLSLRTNTTDDFNPLSLGFPQADLNALRAIVGKIRGKIETPVVLEVGCYVGRASRMFSDMGCLVHCVDTWNGSQHDGMKEIYEHHGFSNVFETFCLNMGDRLGRTVFPYRGESVSAAREWTTRGDLIFIDAEHDYENCKADSEAWWPHLKPGGIMVWHDYCGFPGVTRYCDEIRVNHHCGMSLAWTVKPRTEAPPPSEVSRDCCVSGGALRNADGGGWCSPSPSVFLTNPKGIAR